MSEMIVTLPGGKKIDAQMNGMTIRTDQPAYAGGEGSAPTPFSLFLASIGTCVGIYIQGFCEQRGLSTDGIRIIQTSHRNEAERRIERISLEIQLPEDFPEKYRKAVIASANLCAVKKHIMRPPEFEIVTRKPGD